MKQISIIAALLLSMGVSVFAQGGIAFEQKKSWADLLAEAKSSDKLIFLDAYTTWCGPCKKMSKEIFPQERVGEYYNEHFVNVKMDMEKGEGLQLGEAYDVRAYPTLLFIDGNGELVHRVAGYMEAEDFIALGEAAQDPERALGGLERAYAKGNRDADFLRRYTEARFNAADGSHEEIAEAYLETQTNWGTPENIRFIYQYVGGSDSKAFDYMIANRAQFEQELGKATVSRKLESIIYRQIYYSETPPTLEEAEGIFKQYFPENSDQLYANFKMNYYRQLGDLDGYTKAAVERFEKYDPQDYAELNETAWTFYQAVNDKALLKKALGWAKQSVEMSERYENTDTVAHLYFKLGDKKNAKRYAKKAIKLAKKNGEDFSLTQELLDKVKR